MQIATADQTVAVVVSLSPLTQCVPDRQVSLVFGSEDSYRELSFVDTPTPAGPTQRQIGTELVQITDVRPALPVSTTDLQT